MMNKSGYVTEQAIKVLNLQSATDNPLFFISNNGVPVLDLNPKFTNLVYSGSSTSNGATLFTTPADKDFYLTHIQLAWTKDATADSVFATVRGFIGGAAFRLIQLNAQTTTAGSQSMNISFPYPLKLDRNTAVASLSAKTAGTHSMEYSVMGFYL